MTVTNENARPGVDRPGAQTTVPNIDRARRRLRLHHQLVRRRRWSKELDRLCGRS